MYLQMQIVIAKVRQMKANIYLPILQRYTDHCNGFASIDQFESASC